MRSCERLRVDLLGRGGRVSRIARFAPERVPGGPRRGARRGPGPRRRLLRRGRAPVPADPTLRWTTAPSPARTSRWKRPATRRRGLARPRRRDSSTCSRATAPGSTATGSTSARRGIGARRRPSKARCRPAGRAGTTPPPPASPARGARAERDPARALPHRHPPHRGLPRSASDPFGRGLPSGLAALGRRRARPGGPGAAPDRAEDRHRRLRGRAPSPARPSGSAGSAQRCPRLRRGMGLPPGDGRGPRRAPAGKAERPRAFLDLKLAPIGNALGSWSAGADVRAIRPRWVLRDGRVLIGSVAPSAGPRSPDQLATLSRVEDVPGWDMGPGWEWQPGPVIAGGTVYALARGLGDPRSSDGADRADEVRLFALDLDTAEVLWSRR